MTPICVRVYNDGFNGPFDRAPAWIQVSALGITIRSYELIVRDIRIVNIIVAGSVTTAQHQFALLDVVTQMKLRIILVFTVVNRNIAIFLASGVFRNDALFCDLRLNRWPLVALLVSTQNIT
jgi:hypothetical protein